MVQLSLVNIVGTIHCRAIFSKTPLKHKNAKFYATASNQRLVYVQKRIAVAAHLPSVKNTVGVITAKKRNSGVVADAHVINMKISARNALMTFLPNDLASISSL